MTVMKKGKALQFMLMLTLISVAVFVSAQVALAADAGNLTGLIRGFGLPQDKTNQALTLTGKFLGQVEQSSSSLLKLLGNKAPGQQDANLNEQINLIQRDLNLKKQQFQLDLTDLVGADNANKVIEVVNGAIPAVLQQTPVVAAQPGHDPQGMAGMNMPNTNNTPGTPPSGTGTTPGEAPLGSTTAPNLDLQTNGGNSGMAGMNMPGGTNNMGGMTNMMDMMMNNMNNMKSMMDMMMGGMGNMGGASNNNMLGMGTMGNSTNNNMPGMGSMPMNNDMYRQLLNQLMANNAWIQQQISAANGTTNPAALQQLYQMIANQNSLIQMLIMMQMNTGGSGSMSGGSGGMGMGMGMGMK